MPIRGATGWGALTSTLEIPGIMSDLSTRLEALARQPLDERSARSQLSVTTYFSDELFRRELELIFQHGPRFFRHGLAVAEPAEALHHHAGEQAHDGPTGGADDSPGGRADQ